ncbi:hypothetical protein GPALN_014453 [Globodera pallida]|nr:hypothetical protein GPALN_014453 [Globodera pallida]
MVLSRRRRRAIERQALNLSEFCERNALARVELSADRSIVKGDDTDITKCSKNYRTDTSTAGCLRLQTVRPTASIAHTGTILPIEKICELTNVPTRVDEEQVQPVSASPAVAQHKQPTTIPRLKTAKEKAKNWPTAVGTTVRRSGKSAGWETCLQAHAHGRPSPHENSRSHPWVAHN